MPARTGVFINSSLGYSPPQPWCGLADVRRGAVAKAPATNAETRRIFWRFYDECCYCQGLLMAVMFAVGTGSLGWMRAKSACHSCRRGWWTRLPFPAPRSARMKTPIIRWSKKVWMEGSHNTNIPPPVDVILALAHFKFTSDLARRVDAAMERKSHARDSQKYFQYHRLLQRLSTGNGGFVNRTTRAYQGPESLEDTGLMKWPY
jgi:hypothetical protein